MTSPGIAQPTTPEDEALLRRNVRSVIIDGVGVGIVVGVQMFLPVFLARLGASSLLVGLLTALPALTGVLLAIPMGQFLAQRRNVVPWYSRARVLVQLSLIPIGIAPFFFTNEQVALLVIAIWAIITIPLTMVNITFTVVMGAVAGPRRRQYLMSRRWSVLGATTAVTVAGIGYALDRVIFPLNYQIAFIASAVGGMVSFFFSQQISVPDNDPAARANARSHHLGLRESLALLRRTPAFGRFVVMAFVFNLGFMMALPLFPLYFVREVGASDFSIGLITTVNSGVALIGYFLWTQFTRRKGNVLALRISLFGLACYPLLASLTHDIALLTLLAALAGIFGAGMNLVLFDIQLSTVPPGEVPTYVAIYQVMTYIATLIGPLVGTAIADTVGFGAALILAATLRGAGAVLSIVLRVGE